MAKFQPPNVPFVEANFMGRKHKPTAIVLDLSMTTSDKGAALGVAKNLHRRNAPANSYHYIVDSVEVYRGVWDNLAAYSAPNNAINVLICAEPTEDLVDWNAPPRSLAFHKAASLVAELILAHKIKPRYLTSSDQERWTKRSSRWRGGLFDRIPGAWPSETFMLDVNCCLTIKTR